MTTAPRSVTQLIRLRAMMLGSIAILYPCLLSIAVHVPLWRVWWHPFMPQRSAVVILGILTTWGLWNMRAWAKPLGALLAITCAVDASLIILKLAVPDHIQLFATTAGLLVFFLIIGLMRRIRSEHRYGKNFAVSIAPAEWATPSLGTTADINAKGCYIRPDPNSLSLKLQRGDILFITLEIFTRTIQCDAKVMRIQHSRDGEITGFGVRFLKLSKTDRKILDTAIELLKKNPR